jgi:DNA primase
MSDVKLEFSPSKRYSTKGTLIIFGSDEKVLHSDTLDMADSEKRKKFANAVAAISKAIPKEQLEQAILEKVAQITARKREADDEKQDGRKGDPLDDTPQEVKEATLELLKSDTLFEQISADVRDIGVAGEDELASTLYIIMTSRLLDKPLSTIVQGASSSGKTYTIESVAKLMPPETVVQAHDFTDQALYYLPSGSLRHKVVISGERVQEHRGKDGYAEDNSKAFREMVGSGELRKAVTVKGPDGKPETVLIHQPGPIAYFESSTAANIHDEDATRLLPLATDESASQTRKIIEAQRREAKGQTVSEARRREIIERHHTMQRLLRPLTVRIPYSDSIVLPEAKIVTRRANEQFFSVIRAVALLRQYQKQIRDDETTGEQYIEADEVDYQIVYRLMKGVLVRKYSPMNQQSRDLLDTVLEKTGGDLGTGDYADFTQQDCEKWSGISNSNVRRRLKPLLSAGVIAVDDTSKPYKYKVAKPHLAEGADLNLPMPEDISERIAIMTE